MLTERGIPINTEVAAAIKPLVDPDTQVAFDYVEAVGKIASPIDPPAPAGKGEIDAIAKTITEELRYGLATVEDATADFMNRAQKILANQ